jgi:hypothetical protein
MKQYRRFFDAYPTGYDGRLCPEMRQTMPSGLARRGPRLSHTPGSAMPEEHKTTRRGRLGLPSRFERE